MKPRLRKAISSAPLDPAAERGGIFITLIILATFACLIVLLALQGLELARYFITPS